LRKQRVETSLDPNDVYFLQDVARAEGLSLSALLRRIVRRWVESRKHEEGDEGAN